VATHTQVPSTKEFPINAWAVVAAALAFFPPLCPAILITGHVAVREIKRTGDAGAGLAIFALVMGYLYIIPFVLIGITLARL
jgi:hypothetical protein